MHARSIRKLIYKWAWDTRCRNVDVANVLRQFVNNETKILDAGCGEYGLSAFVPSKNIVGVDVIPSDVQVDGLRFVHGSIISLPFAERSFSVAASVDVLEHLPESVRGDAVKQLVKIADKVILIAFPSGKIGRMMDEAFNKELIDAGQPVPDWLAEHLENEYPETDTIVGALENEAAGIGRKVRTRVFYSENLSVGKCLRWIAVRSKYLYLIGNLTAGFLLPVLPKAKKDNAYRSIILAEFEND